MQEGKRLSHMPAVLFCTGVALEALAIASYHGAWFGQHVAVDECVSLAASCFLLAGAVLFLRWFGSVSWIAGVAAGLLIFAQCINVTGNMDRFDGVFLVGETVTAETWNRPVEDIAFAGGVFLLVLSFLLSALDAHMARLAVSGRHTALLRETDERKHAEKMLRTRERYLAALCDVAQLLLASTGEIPYQKLVEIIGPAARCNRVRLFLMGRGEDGAPLASLKAEWCGDGAEALIATAELRDRPLGESCPRWLEVLQSGGVISGSTADFEESERELLARHAIKAVLILPISIDGELAGVIGFDNCASARPWGKIEQEFLKSAIYSLVQTTERIKAEKTSRESEERYRHLVTSLPVGIYTRTLGEQNRLLTANPALINMFGSDSAEELMALGTGPSFVSAHERRELNRRLGADGHVDDWALHLTRKDGTPFWGRAWAKVVGSGDSATIEGVVIDVTDRKRAEDERAALEEQLRHAQKMEAIGTLATGIAHDFRNILSSILGYAEIAVETLDPNARAHLCLRRIERAGNRASDLIDQILTFSRKGQLKRRPTALGPAIEEAVRLLKGMLPPGIELNRDTDKPCGLAMANATQVHQVIMDLGTNAFHAMRETGGVFELRLEECTLSAQDAASNLHLKEGRYVRLVARDTGNGIPKDIIEHIYEPFFTTKGPHEGTGLGLSTVHGIVRDHDGAIEVHSEAGNGTTFTLYFPLCEEDAVPEEQAETDRHPLEGYERILFVDDEASVVAMAKMGLEALGYSVEGHTNSLDALEAFRKTPEEFDAAILDQIMPDMAGLQLAEKMHEIRASTPIILSSGFSRKEHMQESVEAGLRGFVGKPAGPRELARAVRRALDLEEATPL